MGGYENERHAWSIPGYSRIAKNHIYNKLLGNFQNLTEFTGTEGSKQVELETDN